MKTGKLKIPVFFAPAKLYKGIAMRQIGNKLFPDEGKHLKNKKTGKVCPFGGILLRRGVKNIHGRIGVGGLYKGVGDK